MFVGPLALSAEWQVGGAGNATCGNWKQMTDKTEVLSWMVGFASAVNINYASSGEPEFRMDLLTYKYLAREVDIACKEPRSDGQQMIVILFKLLKAFPVQTHD